MEWANPIALILSIITVSNIVLAGVVVFIERRDIGATWAWLMILMFIPVLGFVVYMLLGRQLKRKNFYNMTEEEQAQLRATVEAQLTSAELFENRTLAAYADLVRMNIRSSPAAVSTDNEIVIYHDGKSKFDALLRDIRAAAREINIQYYIMRRDSLGTLLRDELTRKAKEGVKIRVLYDDIGSREMSRDFFEEMLGYGGEVEAFFPSVLRVVNLRINNRNHRKLCIIDGEVAYIGGFNVGDEYLGLDEKMGYWRDTHLRITGGAVDSIQGRFILDWNKASNRRADFRTFAFRPARHTGKSPVQIIASGPNSETEHLKNMYLKLIVSAKRSIYIQTPYFIPDASFMDACKIALLSGVDLRIMIPNKPDHPFVYWATWAHVGELLPYGAKILLYEKGFMHAKVIVVDGEVASAGTMNIDTRSFRLNFEVNAVVYDEEVARQLSELFMRDSEVCSELTPERYGQRSVVIRLKEAVSRLLSPIL